MGHANFAFSQMNFSASSTTQLLAIHRLNKFAIVCIQPFEDFFYGFPAVIVSFQVDNQHWYSHGAGRGAPLSLSW